MISARLLARPFKRVLKPSNVKYFSNFLKEQKAYEPQLQSEEKELQGGLNKFLNKTYLWSGGGVAGSLGIATIMSSNFMIAQFPSMMLGGFVMSLAGVLAMHFGKYKVISEHETENNSVRVAGFGALVTGMGISTAPMFAAYDLSYVLPPSLLITTFIFSGASVYAMRTNPSTFTKWGPALTGGLLSLVGTSVVGIGAELMLGPNMLSALTHNLNLYAGIPLFSAFVAYDTHIAVERYNAGDPDHLGCSVQLYLDFMNILVRIMQLVGSSRSNE